MRDGICLKRKCRREGYAVRFDETIQDSNLRLQPQAACIRGDPSGRCPDSNGHKFESVLLDKSKNSAVKRLRSCYGGRYKTRTCGGPSLCARHLPPVPLEQAQARIWSQASSPSALRKKESLQLNRTVGFLVDDTRLELVTSRTSSGCATSCANRPFSSATVILPDADGFVNTFF